ncbi:DUF2806 domain-containing protein [Pseudomonas gingeri]
MEAPGEKLVISLWNSLVDRGIGSLLKPWQIRREGAAHADVRRAEILALAQAEVDAAEIRSGRKNFEGFPSEFAISQEIRPLKRPERIEPFINLEQVASHSARQSINDSMRRSINLSKAIVFAESILAEDMSEASDEIIDEDWIFRWRDYVADVNSDSLQHLWGKILAGEVKAPGAFTLRFLEFVRNLSQAEATLISKISPLVINAQMIWRNQELLDAKGLDFSSLMELQDLGVISGVEAFELKYTWRSIGAPDEGFLSWIGVGAKAALVRHEDPAFVMNCPIYMLTSIGKQIVALGVIESDYEYLTACAMQFKQQGCRVSLVDTEKETDGKIKYSNELIL